MSNRRGPPINPHTRPEAVLVAAHTKFMDSKPLDEYEVIQLRVFYTDLVHKLEFLGPEYAPALVTGARHRKAVLDDLYHKHISPAQKARI